MPGIEPFIKKESRKKIFAQRLCGMEDPLLLQGEEMFRWMLVDGKSESRGRRSGFLMDDVYTSLVKLVEKCKHQVRMDPRILRKACRENFLLAAKEIFGGLGALEVSWPRIALLYVLGLQIAEERCKVEGNDRLNDIVEWISESLRLYVMPFLRSNRNGWVSILEEYPTFPTKRRWRKWLNRRWSRPLSVGILFSFLILYRFY